MGPGKAYVPHVLGLLKTYGLPQCACLQINIPVYGNHVAHAQQKIQWSNVPSFIHEKALRFPLIVQSPRLSCLRNKFILET